MFSEKSSAYCLIARAKLYIQIYFKLLIRFKMVTSHESTITTVEAPKANEEGKKNLW